MSRYVVRWSGPALADLRELVRYIKKDNPPAARRMAEKIKEKLEIVRGNPGQGRIVPEINDPAYREVISSPYRIIYHVLGQEVHVLRVWHGRRDPTRSSKGENLDDEEGE